MTPDLSKLRVALVHYWLIAHRGGERVLEALCGIFPQADIFTLVYDPERTSPAIRRHRIQTSFIQKLPFGRGHHRAFLPLYPLALESFDLRGYDLVISSESGPAKGVVTGSDTCHICYCHTPMRYLWNQYHDYRASAGGVTRLAMPFFAHYLRQWDYASAARVDYFAANSRNTARRIRKYYGRPSQVIYPPVDVERFAPNPAPAPVAGRNGDPYYLVVSEMVPYKRIDLAIEAFSRPGRRLVVVGDGPELRRLRQLAGRAAGQNIEFLGRVEDEGLAQLYAGCRAFIFPGEEDFGIAPLEAQASGRPVVAYGRGGALETIVGYDDNKRPEAGHCTGLFFSEQTAEALGDAVARFESIERGFDPSFLRHHAESFAAPRFKQEMEAFVVEKLAEFGSQRQ
jgi:glycosyltransferase involved in cell wall biosynthesis